MQLTVFYSHHLHIRDVDLHGICAMAAILNPFSSRVVSMFDMVIVCFVQAFLQKMETCYKAFKLENLKGI